MKLEQVVRGARVTMDPVKFPKLVGLVFLVDSETVRVTSGPETGRYFVWLVTEDTATRTASRRKVRSAWISDLRAV